MSSKHKRTKLKNRANAFYIENDYEINSVRQSKNIIAALFPQLIIVIAGTLAPLLALTRELKLTSQFMNILICAFIFIIMYGLVVNIAKKKLIIIVIVLVLIAVWVIIYRDSVLNGLNLILEKIVAQVNVSYGTAYTLKYELNGSNPNGDIRMALTVITILYAKLLVDCTYDVPKTLVHVFLGLVVPSGIMVIGHNVYGIAVFAYFVYFALLAVAVSGASSNGNAVVGLEGKAVGISVPILFFLIGLSLLFYKNYSPIDKLNEVKKSVNNMVTDFRIEDELSKIWNKFSFGKTGLTESNNQAQMGTVDSLKLRNNHKFDVEIRSQNKVGKNGTKPLKTLYFKGFVGGKYKDNTWYAKSDEQKSEYIDAGLDEINIFNFEANRIYSSALGSAMTNKDSLFLGDISIMNRDNDNILYTPYYVQTEDAISNDENASELGSGDKEFSFYSFGEEGDYQAFMHAMRHTTNTDADKKTPEDEYNSNVYSKYVYENYLNIPSKEEIPEFYENFETGIIEYNVEYGKYTVDTMNSSHEEIYENGLQIYVDFVIKYLSKCEYTLSPGKNPEGKDFVENFLFHSNKGYCTYFASAATLMFRKMGIPARYVEGYMVSDIDLKTEDNAVTNLEVTGLDGHAWVEIYVDDFGWLPIEVTIGGNNLQENQDTTETSTVNNDQTTTARSTTMDKSSADRVEPSTAENNVEEDAAVDSNKALKIITVLVLALIIPAVGVWIVLYRRKKIILYRLKHIDGKKLYKYIFEMIKMSGGKAQDYYSYEELAANSNIMSGVEKEELLIVFELLDRQMYGKEGRLSDNQRKQVYKIMGKMAYSVIEKRGIAAKIRIRYIWCLI